MAVVSIGELKRRLARVESKKGPASGPSRIDVAHWWTDGVRVEPRGIHPPVTASALRLNVVAIPSGKFFAPAPKPVDTPEDVTALLDHTPCGSWIETPPAPSIPWPKGVPRPPRLIDAPARPDNVLIYSPVIDAVAVEVEGQADDTTADDAKLEALVLQFQAKAKVTTRDA